MHRTKKETNFSFYYRNQLNHISTNSKLLNALCKLPIRLILSIFACKTTNTYMISPSLSRVCISAQDLWSIVVTALLRRAYLTGGPISSMARTIGEEPRRRFDMCLPATPPNILKRILKKNYNE